MPPTRSPPATASATPRSSIASPAPRPPRSRSSRASASASTARRDGGFALGLEAAHSRARIVHVGGDGAGREADARACRSGARDAVDRQSSKASRRGDSSSRTMRFAACSPSGRRGRRCFATDAVVIATGGDRRPLRGEHQPARQLRPGPRACGARRRGRSPTWSSCSSTRPRSMSRAVRCRSSARPCAAKARCSSTTPASGSWPGFPARSLRRATSSRARSGGRRAEGRPRLPRRARGDRRAVRGALSGHRGGLPRSRRRPGARADPGAAGAALSHGRDRGGRRGAELGRGPLGVRRSGLHRAARRQSAGEQLADARPPSSPRSSPARSRARLCARPRASAPRLRLLPPDPAPVRPILSRAAGVTRDGETLRAAVGAARRAGGLERTRRGSRRRRADDRRLCAPRRAQRRRALPPRFSPASC